MFEKELPVCKDCGGRGCVCFHNGFWAAHCEECNNAVDHVDGMTAAYCASEQEAERLWGELNVEGRSN